MMTTHATVDVTTPNDREIVMTRVFNAPRSLVFDCYTKPHLLKRWLTGPAGWTFVTCDNDLKVGGAFHWVWRGPDGRDMGMSGVYREIVRPERIVRTEAYDQFGKDGETLGTIVLSEQGGKTTVTTTLLYLSREARDGALKSGMAKGVSASYERLDELLATTSGHSQDAA
jgi:uncharacterized protein YndB with AHSA1/START domain